MRRNNGPVDLDDLIRESQERLNQIVRRVGSSKGGGSGSLQWLLAVIIAAGWTYMCTNTIQPDENGLVLRLGAYSRTEGPGLHFILWPLEQMEKLVVEAENQIDLGADKNEGLTLASDQNLVDIQFSVLWKIKDARDVLFNIANPEELITRISESAMREVVGRTPSDKIRTSGRQLAQDQVRQLVQGTLDQYKAGILITGVQLERADPPTPVLSSFEEVQRAEQNQHKLIRDAEQYRNQILGQARGDAAKIMEDAKAYKSRVVAEAQGEAQRFISVQTEYEKAPEVTRRRLFLETLEDVLQNSSKVIVESGKLNQPSGSHVPLAKARTEQTLRLP